MTDRLERPCSPDASLGGPVVQRRASRSPLDIAHADLDAFFASVEQRDNAALRGRPVLVGGTGGRGVVAACSYEARQFGIRSAMPMTTAMTLCPEAVVVAPDKDRYRQASQEVMAVLERYAGRFEPVSIDEAFLDLSEVAGREAGTFVQQQAVGTRLAQLREEVQRSCSLTITVGAGGTKMIAKLASGVAKPDGLRVVGPDEALEFLTTSPVREIPGIGPVTTATLQTLGVELVADLERLSHRRLVAEFGARRARWLTDLLAGIDDREVVPREDAKQLSVEQTFERDLVGEPAMLTEIERLVARLVGRLEREQIAGRTVTLKVRDASRETVTRQRTLDHPTREAREILQVAGELLAQRPGDRPVRLLGVGVSHLCELQQDEGPAWTLFDALDASLKPSPAADSAAGAGTERADGGQVRSTEAAAQPLADGVQVDHPHFGAGRVTARRTQVLADGVYVLFDRVGVPMEVSRATLSVR